MFKNILRTLLLGSTTHFSNAGNDLDYPAEFVNKWPIVEQGPIAQWSTNKTLSSMLAGATNGAIFDNFEDGDSNDWFFFNGTSAGGGGGVLSDRPYEGLFYFDTGWGVVKAQPVLSMVVCSRT